MHPQYKLAIFDLDGTLIDSKLDLAHSVNATRAHMSLAPLEHETIYSYVGNGAPVLMRRSMGAAMPQHDVDLALRFFLGYYRDHCLDFTALYPGVRDALNALKSGGVSMAILTNKPVKVSKLIVDGLGLGDHFFQIYGGNSFEQKKPDPVGIHALLSESGVPAEQTLMIGDSGVDIQTARNANVRAVGCTWGFQPEALITNPPDWLIENMLELPAIVGVPTAPSADAII